MGLTHHAGGAHTESSAREGGPPRAADEIWCAGIGRDFTQLRLLSNTVRPLSHSHHLGRRLLVMMPAPSEAEIATCQSLVPSDLAV